jgi:Septum formation
MSRLLSSVGLRFGLIGIFVVGGFLFRDWLPGGADALRVGDCFEEPAGVDVVDDVQHRPCGESHDSEVVFVGEHPAAKGTAPLSDLAFREWIGANCLPAFASYAGVDLMSQEVLDLGYFVPTNEGWDDGDRTVICYAVRVDGAEMTQSVRTN